MNINEIHASAWAIVEEIYASAKERNTEVAADVWEQLNMDLISPVEAMLILVDIARADIASAENEYYANFINA